MPYPTSDNSPSHPNAADQDSTLADRNIQRPQAGFAPLTPNDPSCLLGFRSDASASELYDEASLRQHAVLGLLGVLVLIQIKNGYISAFASIQDGNGATDAAVATGNDRNLAL